MINWVDPDEWKALRAAFEARELVVFAGAGVSAAGGLPLWPKLTELLIERVRRLPGRSLDADDAQKSLQAGRLIEAISATQHALGPVPFGNAVASLLDDQGKEVPPLAREIAALGDKLVGVVTTNIDRFLERASAGEWHEVLEPVGNLGQSRGFLWKAHGTRQNRASWVFARKSYDRVMFGDPQYRATFGALYRARRLLFVGCGLADDDLDFTIGEVRALCGEQPPSHFAIVEEGMGAYRRRSLEDAGIRLITYPKGQHDKVIELLQALRGAPAGSGGGSPAGGASPGPAAPTTGVASSGASAGAMGSTGSLGSAAASSSSPTDGAPTGSSGVPVFVCSAETDADRALRAELEQHAAALVTSGIARLWHTGRVPYGKDAETATDSYVDLARIVLALVTPAFLASAECRRQIDRARSRGTLVIPVLTVPCVWEVGPLGGLQPAPRNRVAVSLWSSRDAAWADVVTALLELIGSTNSQLPPNP